MLGKLKCKTLKSIRKDIAEKNNIPFETPECTHDGDCSGTCPRCEAEIKYLEQQLKWKEQKGENILVKGISKIKAFFDGFDIHPHPFHEVKGMMEDIDDDCDFESGVDSEESVDDFMLAGVPMPPDNWNTQDEIAEEDN